MVSLEAASLLDSWKCGSQGCLLAAIRIDLASWWGWIAQGSPLRAADAGAAVPPWGSSADSLLVLLLLEPWEAGPGPLALWNVGPSHTAAAA